MMITRCVAICGTLLVLASPGRAFEVTTTMQINQHPVRALPATSARAWRLRASAPPLTLPRVSRCGCDPGGIAMENALLALAAAAGLLATCCQCHPGGPPLSTCGAPVESQCDRDPTQQCVLVSAATCQGSTGLCVTATPITRPWLVRVPIIVDIGADWRHYVSSTRKLIGYLGDYFDAVNALFRRAGVELSVTDIQVWTPRSEPPDRELWWRTQARPRGLVYAMTFDLPPTAAGYRTGYASRIGNVCELDAWAMSQVHPERRLAYDLDHFWSAEQKADAELTAHEIAHVIGAVHADCPNPLTNDPPQHPTCSGQCNTGAWSCPTDPTAPIMSGRREVDLMGNGYCNQCSYLNFFGLDTVHNSGGFWELTANELWRLSNAAPCTEQVIEQIDLGNDSDGDRAWDGYDNCPGLTNSLQLSCSRGARGADPCDPNHVCDPRVIP